MEEEKKKNPILRLLAFLLTAALVLGAVFLVANWQKLNFDSLRRWFTYRSLTKNESGQVDSFPYTGGSGSSFARVGDDLLVCSSSGVRLYSSSGSAFVDQPCALTNPFVSVSSSAALVYDAGGSDLYVYRNREQVFSYSAEGGNSILSASLSAQGYLTVVTQGSGVKGTATVYDTSFQRIFGVNLSSRFITDAILSPDGKTLALATSGQTSGIYDSRLLFYRLDRAAEDQEPSAACSLGDNAILQLSWDSGSLRVLGENALVFVDTDGSQSGSYSFDRRYLKGFSLDGEDSCSLLLGHQRAGTNAELVTVSLKGELLAQRSVNEQVLSLSSAGRYLSVLTAGSLTIYTTDDLEVYHTTDDLQGARRVLQRPDGSVTLIAGESARLYLPS